MGSAGYIYVFVYNIKRGLLVWDGWAREELEEGKNEGMFVIFYLKRIKHKLIL